MDFEFDRRWVWACGACARSARPAARPTRTVPWPRKRGVSETLCTPGVAWARMFCRLYRGEALLSPHGRPCPRAAGARAGVAERGVPRPGRAPPLAAGGRVVPATGRPARPATGRPARPATGRPPADRPGRPPVDQPCRQPADHRPATGRPHRPATGRPPVDHRPATGRPPRPATGRPPPDHPAIAGHRRRSTGRPPARRQPGRLTTCRPAACFRRPAAGHLPSSCRPPTGPPSHPRAGQSPAARLALGAAGCPRSRALGHAGASPASAERPCPGARTMPAGDSCRSHRSRPPRQRARALDRAPTAPARRGRACPSSHGPSSSRARLAERPRPQLARGQDPPAAPARAGTHARAPGRARPGSPAGRAAVASLRVMGAGNALVSRNEVKRPFLKKGGSQRPFVPPGLPGGGCFAGIVGGGLLFCARCGGRERGAPPRSGHGAHGHGTSGWLPVSHPDIGRRPGGAAAASRGGAARPPAARCAGPCASCPAPRRCWLPR